MATLIGQFYSPQSAYFKPMPPPIVIESVGDARSWVEKNKRRGETVGFVPTMGALHAGHLSLVERARQACDRVVVSVFVNPTQFGPGEDYQRYPRDLASDVRCLAELGVEMVFAPDVEELYPPGDDTRVTVGRLAEPWEGAFRPGHFDGVTTVVAKLFAAVPAQQALFGRKDYQQTVVVQRMVRDLLLPIEIVVCPIVREADGLAMSSRNAYLSDEQRRQAVAVPRSLERIESLAAGGENDVAKLREEGLKELSGAEGVEPQYLAFVREGTVEEVARIEGPTAVVVAARVGSTRLIDNRLIDRA